MLPAPDHSPVQLAVVAGPAAVCAALARRLPARPGTATTPRRVTLPPAPDGGPLCAANVLAAQFRRTDPSPSRTAAPSPPDHSGYGPV